MGGYAAATAAPIVNPYALMLMCPGAGMWFGCKDRAEAMEVRGSPRPILKDSLSQHLLIMIYLIMSHSRQQKDTTDQSSL